VALAEVSAGRCGLDQRDRGGHGILPAQFGASDPAVGHLNGVLPRRCFLVMACSSTLL